MQIILELLATLVALALFVPAVVLFLECLASLLPAAAIWRPPSAVPETVVLVPAHDEEAGLGATLAALKGALGENQRILVIADNCTDRTADVARAAGVEVIERRDPSARGKGYALAFGLEHLLEQPPLVVGVVDADCRVGPGSLALIARRAHDLGRPVQAAYLLEAPATADPRTMVSGFAIVLRNRVRCLGLARLGLPCPLLGSGMAFPWHVIRKAPPTGSYLVEDMLMGIELARLGHPPLYEPEASVTSALPEGDAPGLKQRRRWEHGHLETLRRSVPVLLSEAVRDKRLDLAAMALDLLVPPLSLLVLLLGGTWLVTGFLALIGLWDGPFTLATLALFLVALGVGVGWAAYGRGVIPPRQMLSIPAYILWKIPLYLSFARRGSHRSWERTERSAPPWAPAADPGPPEATGTASVPTAAPRPPAPEASARPPGEDAAPSSEG